MKKASNYTPRTIRDFIKVDIKKDNLQDWQIVEKAITTKKGTLLKLAGFVFEKIETFETFNGVSSLVFFKNEI